MTRYSSSVRRRLMLDDLGREALPVGMLQLQDLVDRPVEVIGHVRDLLEEPVGCVRHDPPRRSTRQVDRELVLAGRAADGGLAGALLVDPPVQVLEECQVGREQVLDDARMDLATATRAG